MLDVKSRAGLLSSLLLVAVVAWFCIFCIAELRWHLNTLKTQHLRWSEQSPSWRRLCGTKEDWTLNEWGIWYSILSQINESLWRRMREHNLPIIHQKVWKDRSRERRKRGRGPSHFRVTQPYATFCDGNISSAALLLLFCNPSSRWAIVLQFETTFEEDD